MTDTATPTAGVTTPDDSTRTPITARQLTLLGLLCTQHGFTREGALEWIGGVIGRAVQSRKDLTKTEASEVIDLLADGSARKSAAGDTLSVNEAVARVTHDVGKAGVGKHGVNREQNYSFRGIDDVVNALSPILAKHGVTIVPRVKDVRLEERPTRSGGVQMFATLVVNYRIYGPAGDYLSATTVGLGSDTSDKATNKAMSAAFKYLLGQVFAIPDVGWAEADLDSPQTEPRGQRDDGHPGDRPPPAADRTQVVLDRIVAHANDAGVTLEDFTAKFREANGNVPLIRMKGMPLSILEAYLSRIEQFIAAKAKQEANPDADAASPASPSAPPADGTPGYDGDAAGNEPVDGDEHR